MLRIDLGNDSVVCGAVWLFTRTLRFIGGRNGIHFEMNGFYGE